MEFWLADIDGWSSEYFGTVRLDFTPTGHRLW
jgi:hypothetical protein